MGKELCVCRVVEEVFVGVGTVTTGAHRFCLQDIYVKKISFKEYVFC